MKTRYWIIIISILVLINISTITYYEIDKKRNEELMGYSSRFLYEIEIINDNDEHYSLLMPVPVYNATRDRKYIPDFMDDFTSVNDSAEWDCGYPQDPRSHDPYLRIFGELSDTTWVHDESSEIEPSDGMYGFIAEHYFNEIYPMGDSDLYRFNYSFPIFNERNSSDLHVSVLITYHLSSDFYNGFKTLQSTSGTTVIITGSGKITEYGWNYFPVNVQCIAFD